MAVTQKILYVDDDADDRVLLFDAIKDINPTTQIDFAENGLKAIDYLTSINTSELELPGLIVIDLNMPFMDGKETVQHIKSERKFDHIKIVIFSSSENPNDKALFQNLGIEFISKPDNYTYLNKVANYIVNLCTVKD